MLIRTSVNQMPENYGIQVGQCWKGLIRSLSEAMRLGADVLFDYVGRAS